MGKEHALEPGAVDHVDGERGTVERDRSLAGNEFRQWRRSIEDETTRFVFDAPAPLAKFVAGKGSVALDGTSLTVNMVDGTRFECMLLPHTLKVPTWNERKVADKGNHEV